jgi:hypothetical protein
MDTYMGKNIFTFLPWKLDKGGNPPKMGLSKPLLASKAIIPPITKGILENT